MEDSAGPQPESNDHHQHTGLAKYARPALIAGSAIAVVCLALLVIIFFLDSFNATVYSVGGKNIQDATDEARQIRESYTAVRTGGLVFLIASVVTALAAAVVLYRNRNVTGDDGTDDGDDVDFEDLAGR
jgi:ABC-type Fe3+ transport system permease subunit